ncbi:zinc transporter ZIP10-like [Chiloscyllium plagiosum]|uniref:zinc transporter ZIP10-like n=1 Tax=Chiloscyllium plagiosum TaxID=36176 RepID=UPI001CB84D88|nr:zinc transporter ZIP10-like [Chiloscyllium plagiosum]
MRGVLWPAFLLGTLCAWAGWDQAMGGEARSRETRSIPEAVTEQRYYLRRLFGNYGRHRRLSPEGLRRLFESLGLGQVQVVEIEHEGLGHGHVSHLDALDLQEHRHVHSHTTEDHLSKLARGSQDPTGAGTSIQAPRVTTASSVRSSKWTSGERVEPPLFRKDSPGAGGSMFGHRLERSPRDHPLPASSHGLTDDDRAMNHSDYNHLHGNCLNVTQLLVNFGMSSTQGITPKQFTYICPALLYQIDSRVCIQHHDTLQIPPQGATRPSEQPATASRGPHGDRERPRVEGTICAGGHLPPVPHRDPPGPGQELQRGQGSGQEVYPLQGRSNASEHGWWG